MPKMVETTSSKALNVRVNVMWLSNWTPRHVTTDDTGLTGNVDCGCLHNRLRLDFGF